MHKVVIGTIALFDVLTWRVRHSFLGNGDGDGDGKVSAKKFWGKKGLLMVVGGFRFEEGEERVKLDRESAELSSTIAIAMYLEFCVPSKG